LLVENELPIVVFNDRRLGHLVLTDVAALRA